MRQKERYKRRKAKLCVCAVILALWWLVSLCADHRRSSALHAWVCMFACVPAHWIFWCIFGLCSQGNQHTLSVCWCEMYCLLLVQEMHVKGSHVLVVWVTEVFHKIVCYVLDPGAQKTSNWSCLMWSHTQ